MAFLSAFLTCKSDSVHDKEEEEEKEDKAIISTEEVICYKLPVIRKLQVGLIPRSKESSHLPKQNVQIISSILGCK